VWSVGCRVYVIRSLSSLIPTPYGRVSKPAPTDSRLVRSLLPHHALLKMSIFPSSDARRQRRTAKNRDRSQANRPQHRQRLKQPRTVEKPVSNQQQKSNRLPLLRLLLVWSVLMGTCVAMGMKLYRLQVIHAPKLFAQARKQQLTSMPGFVIRRPVVDCNQNVLAMDRLVYHLYARPGQFNVSKEKIADRLAPLLQSSPAQLVKRFNQPSNSIRLTSVVPEEMFQQIDSLTIDGKKVRGLELVPQFSRFYPQHTLAADIVGYVNTDREGKAGVEASHNQQLESLVKPIPSLSRNGNNEIMSYSVPDNFAEVDDTRLELTVDLRLQRAAQAALSKQLKAVQAKRGSVIVMDARDGSILAMVDEPSYDPNEFYKFDFELFRNWAISDLYEPGSTFKPLNVAIALELKAIHPNEIFPDPDTIKIGGRIIKNADPEPYKELSVAGILQHSSNVGMVQIAQRIPPATYYDWLKKLGVGQSLATDLAAVAPSQIKSKKQFVTYPIEPATASFGQGFALTPIKLVQLHAALANGGKLVTPHVVRGRFDANGHPQWQPTLPTPQQVFSPSVAKTVLEMMETVVKQGSGKSVRIPGYRIAGKTGTAQKASARGGYDSTAKITSFVSILPVDAPRYVILAVIDEPTKVPKGQLIRGSTTAVPVVKSVIDALISTERIPPNQPTQRIQNSDGIRN
jgi:cell division protein FtsI (penicillin-binding protein 3)